MKPSPADIRNLVLLSVATASAGFLVVAFPFVALPLAGFALGWIAFRFGGGPSIAVALGSGALVAAFGSQVVSGMTPLDGLFVAVTLLAVGPGAAWALKRRSAYTVAVVATLVAAGAYLVAPIGTEVMRGSMELLRQIFDGAATSGSVSDPAALKQSAEALLTGFAATWPSTAVYTMGIGMFPAVALVSRAGRALGHEVNRYPALADTDLTFHLVWPAILGLAMLAAGTFLGDSKGTVYAVGINLLAVVRPALALQGLAVFGALYRKIGVGKTMRVIGLGLLVITEWIVPSVSVLGLADLFFNLRKFPRPGAAKQRAD